GLVLSDCLVELAPDDVQGAVVADCIATKKPLAGLKGYKIEPMSHAVMVKWIVEGFHLARHNDADVDPPTIVSLSRGLRSGGPRLLRDRRVARHLRDLKADPSDAVRASVDWYAGGPPGSLERFADRVTTLFIHPARRMAASLERSVHRLLQA